MDLLTLVNDSMYYQLHRSACNSLDFPKVRRVESLKYIYDASHNSFMFNTSKCMIPLSDCKTIRETLGKNDKRFNAVIVNGMRMKDYNRWKGFTI